MAVKLLGFHWRRAPHLAAEGPYYILGCSAGPGVTCRLFVEKVHFVKFHTNLNETMRTEACQSSQHPPWAVNSN